MEIHFEAYHKIFDESVAIYNAKQKRKDRRINNYLESILNDKRKGKHKNLKADGSRKPAYEMIIQIGNRDNCPDDETAKKILKDFSKYSSINLDTSFIDYRNLVIHDSDYKIPMGIYFKLENQTKKVLAYLIGLNDKYILYRKNI